MFVMILIETPIMFKSVIKYHVQCVLRFSKMCVVSLHVIFGLFCEHIRCTLQRGHHTRTTHPFWSVLESFTHCALLSALFFLTLFGHILNLSFVFLFCFTCGKYALISWKREEHFTLSLMYIKEKDGWNFRGCVYNFVVLFFISAHGCCVAAVATVKQYGHIVIS